MGRKRTTFENTTKSKNRISVFHEVQKRDLKSSRTNPPCINLPLDLPSSIDDTLSLLKTTSDMILIEYVDYFRYVEKKNIKKRFKKIKNKLNLNETHLT